MSKPYGRACCSFLLMVGILLFICRLGVISIPLGLFSLVVVLYVSEDSVTFGISLTGYYQPPHHLTDCYR